MIMLESSEWRGGLKGGQNSVRPPSLVALHGTAVWPAIANIYANIYMSEEHYYTDNLLSFLFTEKVQGISSNSLHPSKC